MKMYKEMTIPEKRNVIVTNTFRALFTLAIITSIISGNYMNIMTAGVTLVIGYIPTFINKKGTVEIIPEISIIMLVFLFAANFLGEFFSFYHIFWWWDVVLHTLSGVFLGFGAFILVYTLNSSENIGVQLSPILVGLFALTFAMAAGVVWEIFEYGMDTIVGTNMQKSGLVDTMQDLMVDTAGALFASITCYLYLKNGRESKMTRIIEKYLEANEKKVVK